MCSALGIDHIAYVFLWKFWNLTASTENIIRFHEQKKEEDDDYDGTDEDVENEMFKDVDKDLNKFINAFNYNYNPLPIRDGNSLRTQQRHRKQAREMLQRETESCY